MFETVKPYNTEINVFKNDDGKIFSLCLQQGSTYIEDFYLDLNNSWDDKIDTISINIDGCLRKKEVELLIKTLQDMYSEMIFD